MNPADVLHTGAEFVARVRRARAQGPRCPTCNLPAGQSPGTVHCASQHGRCPLCSNWATVGHCGCLTTDL